MTNKANLLSGIIQSNFIYFILFSELSLFEIHFVLPCNYILSNIPTKRNLKNPHYTPHNVTDLSVDVSRTALFMVNFVYREKGNWRWFRSIALRITRPEREKKGNVWCLPSRVSRTLFADYPRPPSPPKKRANEVKIINLRIIILKHSLNLITYHKHFCVNLL